MGADALTAKSMPSETMFQWESETESVLRQGVVFNGQLVRG